MKKIYLGMLLMFAGPAQQVLVAQDIQLSQFYQTTLYRNPAFAGIMKGDIRAQVVTRSQWNSIANAYKTGSFNLEYRTKSGSMDDYVTWGLQVYHDRAGTADLRSTLLMPAFNYHRSLSQTSNQYLSLAVMGGLVQRRIDRSKITTNTTYETGADGEDQLNTGVTFWDGSVGISYNAGLGENERNNMLLGFAYHHFNKPNNSFFNDPAARLDPKMVFSADIGFGLNDYSSANFYSDYLLQGSYRQFMTGILYGLQLGAGTEETQNRLQGGAFLRWGDAVIPTLKLDYGNFAFGFSYDVNISKLSAKSSGRGGFELSVSWSGFRDPDGSGYGLKCPRFY